MNTSIFREKSLEKISSPMDLNNYMRVINPSVWFLLLAIIALLIGTIIWGIYGNLESTSPAIVVSENGNVNCYVSEKYIDKIESGMTVRIEEEEFSLGEKNPIPVESKENLSDYAFYLGGFASGEYVYCFALETDLASGTYSGEIITEKIHAISFIWNN